MKRVKILRRRRKSDEVTTARHAIRNMCLECCGYAVSEVERCTAPECWLWPWRMGKTPLFLKRTPSAGGVNENLRRSDAEKVVQDVSGGS